MKSISNQIPEPITLKMLYDLLYDLVYDSLYDLLYGLLYDLLRKSCSGSGPLTIISTHLTVSLPDICVNFSTVYNYTLGRRG